MLTPRLVAFERFLMALQSAAFSRPQQSYWITIGRQCQQALRLLRLEHQTEETYALQLRQYGLNAIALSYESGGAAHLVCHLPGDVAASILQHLRPSVGAAAEPESREVVPTQTPAKRLVFGVDVAPELPFLTRGGKVRKRR